MTGLHDRRGFLRGLATLPLIGGGVALIGNPTRADEPITPALLKHYVGWLGREYGEAHDELLRTGFTFGQGSWGPIAYQYGYRVLATSAVNALVESAPPSSRAAVVLSAVGVDWREAS